MYSKMIGSVVLLICLAVLALLSTRLHAQQQGPTDDGIPWPLGMTCIMQTVPATGDCAACHSTVSTEVCYYY